MTREFNQVALIAESNESNKSAKYLELAKQFAKEAHEIMEVTTYWMTRNCAQEVINSFRKAESADCEYTAYVNAAAAEVWLSKAIDAEDSRIDEE